MTKLTTGVLPACALLLGLCSCGDDEGLHGRGSGKIAPQVCVDHQTVQKAKARSAAAIDVEQLTLSLTSADGSFEESWSGVSAFPTDRQFRTGDYTLTACYGSIDDEGFDKPCYLGSAHFKVVDSQTATPTVTATLANQMVSVSYTDAFRRYMTDWSAEVHAAGGAYISVGKDELRPAYLRPGTTTVNVSFTKPNGKSATLQAISFEGVARHHYTVTVDINNGQVGDAVMTVTFDDSTVSESIDIELSDELLSSPAPTATAAGFEHDQALHFNAGNTPDLHPKFNLMARGGLAAVTMTTQSRALLAKGWPAELDLLSADAAQQTALNSLGFKGMGLWRNPDKMAAVDLSGIIEQLDYLPGGDNQTAVTLVVRDRLGKVSDPLTLRVAVEVPFTLNCNDADVYTNRAALSLTSYSNETAASLAQRAQLQLATGNGTYQPVNVTADNGRWQLNGLQPGTRYSVRVLIDGVYSLPETFTTESLSQIPNGNFEQTVSIDGRDGNWENYVIPGWGTNNPMTTGNGANYAYCRISGTKPTDDAHSGSQAMRVSTQGWGGGNTASGLVSTGVCNRLDAGLLHLGASRYGRPEGYTGTSGPLTVDDLQCGIPFSSRPSAVSFWYKYQPKNGSDHGLALVRVLDAAGRVITQAEVELGRQDSYVQRTLSLTYPAGAAKAAKLHVCFMSTNVPDALTKSSSWLNAPSFGNTSRGEYYGSRLFIDDVTLTY